MLSPKTNYLQIALNSTLSDAQKIIHSLPVSPRILIEAGTPLIKTYGSEAISHLRQLWQTRCLQTQQHVQPYIIADLKCMDRAETEVNIAASAGASAAVVLGSAPIETLNSFIASCQSRRLDSLVDFMNVPEPYKILRQLPRLPTVAVLHRGVDEERFSQKLLPIHMINKIKGTYNLMVAIAGGDTKREIQSSFFNGANIVVLWKHFYRADTDTGKLAQDILNSIR